MAYYSGDISNSTVAAADKSKVSIVSRKKAHSDLNLKLTRHPIRKDIIPLKDDAAIQNAIKNLTKNKTTIVIAHRLSTIHNADKIFVLQNGVLVDSGKHDHLINNCQEYKTLYEKQLK